MSNDERVFCQNCGEALKIWDEPSGFPYDRWLKTPCASCGTRPTESRSQDSDLLPPPLGVWMGAVALAFEQLATSLRKAITMICFDEPEGRGEIAEAMLGPLSYSEQVRVFSAVCLARFPDKDAEIMRFQRKLVHAGEGRNRVLHSWWIPGKLSFKSGIRVDFRISGGKLGENSDEVSVRELTHLTAFMNSVSSDLLGFVFTALGRLPVSEPEAAGMRPTGRRSRRAEP
jgi:hypothetical protein